MARDGSQRDLNFLTDPLGALLHADGSCGFRVWAPRARRVDLRLYARSGTSGGSGDRQVEMGSEDRGYFAVRVPGVSPGMLYRYVLDGHTERPDPASAFQPEGVHGPSAVVSREFDWTDAGWLGPALRDYVLYELHTGTFTPEGTFDAIVPRLGELQALGITAVELMPVAQFPGTRNWGYDGAYPFAVQNSYGGPAGLKRLVNACHQHGLAVVLDVVYNHLGPEGNYLADFGYYFTDRYRTPWGPAINFDGPHSDEVRRFFIENALRWVTEFHVDALRLDAIHAIFDASAAPFLEELGAAVHERAAALERRIYVIPESDLNDARVIRPREAGGFGLDAQWNDDFHHALHVLLTGERQGYYADFAGTDDLATAFRDGFVYSGRFSAFRRRRHGNRSADLPGEQFVVFAQNHDQVGNRRLGERLTQLVPFEALKLTAATVLLSPYLPLLFMGEEYGEPAPFQYFISHLDPALVEAVRAGRREEFAPFGWDAEVPDPQAEETFQRCRLNWGLRHEGHHAVLLDYYRELLRLRQTLPALAHLEKRDMEIRSDSAARVLAVHRRAGDNHVWVFLHFGAEDGQAELPAGMAGARKVLDSAEVRWSGPGTQAPEEIAASGCATLSLKSHQAVVFSL